MATKGVKHSWGGGGGGFAVLVHGGAGRGKTAQQADRQAAGCLRAAEKAVRLLEQGASALDAVQCAVEAMEDDPLFNAGTGGALTCHGHLELSASIMEGGELQAGGVCALPPYRNPVAIARAVLEGGRHVLYAAQGADAFAKKAGFEPVEAEQMITPGARKRLKRALERKTVDLWSGGTVGAVVQDGQGHLAAATSTGGLVGQDPGRVGDSPIPGAGTYADDGRGASSATGKGEGILRISLSARGVSLMGEGAPPEQAARMAIAEMAERTGCTGGVILVAPGGRLGLARSTSAMAWAAAWEGGMPVCGK